MLRIAHRIDLTDNSIILTNKKKELLTPQYNSPISTFSSPDSGIVLLKANNRRLYIKDLMIQPQLLIHDIKILAEMFQQLNMDNEQLAILSAILIFQSNFLPKVFFILYLIKFIIKIL